MYDFEQNKVNKIALAKRRPILGTGINDAPYLTQPTVEGKIIACPYYQKWHGMMARCYSPIYHKRQPTYADCTVVPSWHSFMAFREWMVKQKWEGLELDKDLKYPGNKMYSPYACLFIPQALNKLFTDHAAARGLYPIGVSLYKSTGQYAAQIRHNSKKKRLGLYPTPELASEAYQAERNKKITQLIREDTYPEFTGFLHQYLTN